MIDGTKIGEPYREQDRNVVWTGVRLGARRRTRSANLYPGGIFGGNGDPGNYHAITIPGTYKLDGLPGRAPGPAIDNIKTGFYLIRDNANTSMYLIKGSTKALLVGTGSRHARDRRVRQAARRRRCRSRWS